MSLPTIERLYYFTHYGDVYSGLEFDVSQFDNHTVLLQADKRNDFSKLSQNNITLEKIREYGYAVPNSSIAEVLKGDIHSRTKSVNLATGFPGDIERKDLFIFGAGASANCITSYQKDGFQADSLRPPLGNDLFANRFKPIYKKYEGVCRSIFDLQTKGINVEEHLENEWGEITDNCNPTIMSNHINIQFYLQELLSKISTRVTDEYFECNLYAKFAQTLQRESSRNRKRHFGIVSFNQDTILDHFLSQYFNKGFKEISDYIDTYNSPFCLFKPHGSWNWGWKFPRHHPNHAGGLFKTQKSYYDLYYKILGTPEHMLDWHSYAAECMLHDHGIGRFTIDKSLLQVFNATTMSQHYPALLLPYRDKDEFTLPLRHFYCLKHYIEKVENVYVVGWKGNEKAFIKLLLTSGINLKKLVIVDPYPDAVLSSLGTLLSRHRITPIVYSTFEDFVLHGFTKELTQ